jgi:hypothetical protein
MRIGAAISVAAHVAALTVCLLLAGVRPFDPTTAEAITVDIVTPDQAPPLPKEPDPTYDFPTLSEKEQQDQSKAQEEAAEKAPEPPQPAPMSAPPEKSKADAKQAALQQQKPVEPPKPVEQMKPVEQQQQQQARPQSQPQDQPAATPQEQEQPVVPTAQPDITSKFGMMFTLPEPGAGGDFDAKATASANIKVEDAAALRAHLKTCSILPKSVSPSDNVRIVLRVAFLPDGRLGKEPLLIEASASEKGPALMQSAMKALASCQPYAMLPADRYNEWRMLDLAFTPKDFKGG